MAKTPKQTAAQAFLKKKGMSAQQWKAFTAARFATAHPAPVTHAGIDTSINDYNAVKAKIFDPTDAAHQALLFAQSQVTPESQLKADSTQRDTNITGAGDELLRQLGGIQVANANGANAGVGLFTQGAKDADQSVAGQVFSAGGTAKPSVAPDAAATLAGVAANNNNVFAGDQAAAAKQNLLYHVQERNNLSKTLTDRADNVSKLAAQELENAQNRAATETGNLLTYSLYNTQEADKTSTANKTLSQNAKIASQKAAAKAIDQQIAQANAETKRLAANGTITTAQANLQFKKASALKDVLTHQSGTTSTGTGTKTWTVNVMEPTLVPDPKGGAASNGLDAQGKQIYKTVLQPKVLKNISDAQYQQFLNSGPAGQRKLALLGAKTGSSLVPGSAPTAKTTGASSTTSKAWTWPQAARYLMQNGYSPEEIKTVQATYGLNHPKNDQNTLVKLLQSFGLYSPAA